MLKIKDNVDLNILIEQYGFKPKYDEETGRLIELYRINGHYIGETEKRRRTTTITEKEYNKRTRHTLNGYWNWLKILLPCKNIKTAYHQINLDMEDYEILYDLIKADLVEKI